MEGTAWAEAAATAVALAGVAVARATAEAAAAGAEGGSLTVRQLSADLADESEGEVTEVDVVDRLRHLHQLRLISV